MSRIYVGNLPIDVKEREIDDLFYKFGDIRSVEIKRPVRPPAYAFVTFYDRRDADDAIRRRDGYDFDGERLRCEFAKDSREDDRPGGIKKGTGHRVFISGLPKSCSWQDLKDFARKAGDVLRTDVDRDGSGTIEYANKDDMEYAIKKLDDTEFSNRYDKATVRVSADKAESGSGRRSSSRTRDRSRSRSRDRRKRSESRSRSRSRSASRSRSPVAKASSAKDED